MAGFHLAGGAVNTLAFFLCGDNLSVFQIFVHGGGDFQAEVIVDVHSIHLDKNRDVIGNPHHFAFVHADTVDERLQKIIEVVVRIGQLLLGSIKLPRIDGVIAETGHPALIHIVKIVCTCPGGDVQGQLLQHLFEWQYFDLDIDPGGRCKLGFDQFGNALAGRRGFRRHPNYFPLERFTDIFNPGHHIG